MTPTLFERLGGTKGISMIVDDAVEAHMNNPAVNARFLPLKEQPERLEVIRQHTIEFFSAGSGGPPVYNGQDMVTAHRGMNISHAEYMHVIDDIFASLDKNSINEETKKDVLFILWSLKEMILSK
jgi:hemoglobin